MGNGATYSSEGCYKLCLVVVSLSPARASNKRVLQPYSESMKDLLRNGYKAMKRPSGHDISEKFSKDNGAAIPPNLSGNSQYREQWSVSPVLQGTGT